jgi:hypothetical protein
MAEFLPLLSSLCNERISSNAEARFVAEGDVVHVAHLEPAWMSGSGMT